MKKLIYGIITLFLITFVQPIQAQETYVGIIGGLNFADLEITLKNGMSNDFDVGAKTKVGIGALFGISFNKYLSLQLEPKYIGKGGLVTQTSTPDITMKSSQLDIPLILKAGIGEKIRPYIFAGMFISFVLDASMEAEVSGILLKGDLTQVLEQTEYGALFGAGINVPVWIGSAFVEGRYALGLTNLNLGGNVYLKYNNMSVAGIQLDPGDKIKTKGISIMLGYIFPLSL
ncbi:MAG: porin family protein [Ignavibacteriaceae bacterium]|jgi:hypothetical protein